MKERVRIKCYVTLKVTLFQNHRKAKLTLAFAYI